MKEFITNIFSQLGYKLAVLILLGTTAITTGSAVAKIAGTTQKADGLEKSLISNSLATESSEVSEETDSSTKSSKKSSKPIINSSPTPGSSSTIPHKTVVATTTTTPTPTKIIPTPTINLISKPTASPTLKATPSPTITRKYEESGEDDESLERNDTENEDHYINKDNSHDDE